MNSICACCGEPGKVIAHGWRQACYFRWRRAGQPKAGPPPRRRMRMEDRFAEYMFLRDAGEAPAEAGRRVGLTSANRIWIYEARRKSLAQHEMAVA